MQKLCPGPGATAEVLTRILKPPVSPIPDDKKHRSFVVIVDCIEVKGKHRYTFHLEGSAETELFRASCKFLKIVKEGDPSLFFEEIETPITTSKSKQNVKSNSDGFKKTKYQVEKIKSEKAAL